jgi:uncharacterized damage-inducible protein DinB
MSHPSPTLDQLLVGEAIRRICEENIPRLRQCLRQLDQEQIWHRPGPTLVSVGNLILHLHGNARQWLLHTLCGIPYPRDRDREFDEQGPLPLPALLALLDRLDTDLRQALPRIDEAALRKEYEVQVFRENGVAVLVHAVEHFSYHTGQVARETKRMRGLDLGFYASHDL